MIDTEKIFFAIEQDLEFMAKKHDEEADCELALALGASSARSTKMHTKKVEHHRLLAKMLRDMINDALEFVETYDYEEE